MNLIAELFRRKKSKEIFAHQRQNALQGYSNGGRPAYGYQRMPIEVEGKPKVECGNDEKPQIVVQYKGETKKF